MLGTLLSAALLAVAAYDAAVVVPALIAGRQLAAASEAYEQHPPTATASLLVVGDSTGVGTGARDPGLSIAGRLGAELPTVRIDNGARNGAKTRAVTAQLAGAPQAHYAAVLIQVGGNDALRFTPLAQVAETIDRVLAAATARADYVALMSTGDLGAAPAIPWPLSAVYGHRSRALRDRFAAAAARHGVAYVDLFADTGDNGFEKDPARYYARDGLHLSGAGYGLWYERLRAATALPERLADRGGD
mgnify:CR=1 FL=1